MEIHEKDKNHEILVSKAINDLTTFSSSALAKRGLDVANLAIETTFLTKAEEFLLSVLRDDGLKKLGHITQQAVIDAARLLLEKNRTNIQVIFRLKEISKDLDWDDYIRLDALEILAMHGHKKFSIEKILEIFDFPHKTVDHKFSNSRTYAIRSLAHIKDIDETTQIKLLNFALTHTSEYLLFELMWFFEQMDRISDDVIRILNKSLIDNIPPSNKLDICEMLIEVGQKDGVEMHLRRFKNYKGKDSPQVIEHAQRLLKKLRTDDEIEDLLGMLNDQSEPIEWKIDSFISFMRRWRFRNKVLPSMKINNAAEWFDYLIEKAPEIDYSLILELLMNLIDIGENSDYVISQLLSVAKNKNLAFEFRTYALDRLRDVTLDLDTIYKTIIPFAEDESEQVDIRFAAASIMCKYPITRYSAVGFMLSQRDYVMDYRENFERFEQISLLGYDQDIAKDLSKYITDKNTYVKKPYLRL